MTSIFNLFIIIPIVNILLLAINFILAPHKPYKEKKTPFECGYHSFLSQNRTQFTVSFFLFGLLFLIFDAEIVSIYPGMTSSSFNGSYGMSVIVLFVLILALGLVFELGKGALKIDSKQERAHLRSSVAPAIFMLFYLQVPLQIVDAFYDFYNKKVKSVQIYLIIGFSLVFNGLIKSLSFVICSPWCVNLVDYSTFSFFLSILLLMFYAYILEKKSDIYTFFYHLTSLLLVLFFLSVFWFIISSFIGGVCLAISVLFSNLIFADSSFDFEGDVANPFTGQENISAFCLNFLNGENILCMDGDETGSSDTEQGNTDFGSSGNPGGPDGPDGSGIVAAAVVATEASNDSVENSSPYVDITQSERLGALKHNDDLRQCINTEIEVSQKPEYKFRFLVNQGPHLDEAEPVNHFFEQRDNDVPQTMREINFNIEMDLEKSKEMLDDCKKEVDGSGLTQDVKNELKQKLDDHYEKASSEYENAAKKISKERAKELDPNYEGYEAEDGSFFEDSDGKRHYKHFGDSEDETEAGPSNDGAPRLDPSFSDTSDSGLSED